MSLGVPENTTDSGEAQQSGDKHQKNPWDKKGPTPLHL